MQSLRWKSGDIISVTALQKPFSFDLFDQKMRQGGKKNDEKWLYSKTKRTTHCLLREHDGVAPLHVVLPLASQLYGLAEDRTRILLRFVNSASRLKKVAPKKVILQEIRWTPYLYVHFSP